ncbi:DNA polymerase III delta prime subunit [Erythrobacter sp. NAP1]|uniref:DNA polymerase III subunit delta' n=1 Tax=Erythrobacter sp. NAP1 TaxID=237727 RepID=UPI0000686EA5|nr:DNA polymerase III subunit delta' [Erythrobacter sp. NAP1]EAQ30204.1 DNA polymerase III delta prime subunit [Erythrobacter sp. NAP1]
MTNWPNHEGPWREWRGAMSGARMHHGWLLAGKSGLGKHDFAMAAARELVAEEGIPQPPGDHPDIIVLTYGPKNDKEARAAADGKDFERARSIRVDQVRAMQRRLNTRPTLGSRRVVIIDPADDMEVAAANALLKSLEEPPQGTFFMLVTHRPSRLLPTIRSRCRILRFPILKDVQLEEMLDASGIAGGGDARLAAIRAAEGSYGAALRFAEQDLGPLANAISTLLTKGDPQMTGRSELTRLIGGRADRVRLDAVFELAQAVVADLARSTDNPAQRAKLVDTHRDLVKLAAQAPTYNFDTGLLSVEIGSLLTRAAPASEHAHVRY